MTPELIPDIPRWITALAEWSACVVYILLMRKRIPTAPLVATLLSGLVIIWGVQEIAGSLPLGLWTAGMLMAVFSMYALIFACAQVTAREAGDLVARAFVLAELVASLQWQLHVFFRGDASFGAGSIIVLLVVFAGGFGGAYLFERRQFPPDVHLVIDNRALVTSLAIAAATFFVSNLSFLTDSTPFSGRLGPEVMYIRTLVDLAGFVVLYAQRGQRLEVQRAIEVQSMNTLLRSQHDRYLQSRELMDEVNSRYHDLKQYMQAIRSEPDSEVRAAVVDRLEQQIKGYEAVSLDTGNTVVDTMLTTKTTQAAHQGITVTSVVDGAALDFMDVIDIVTVFGNALDNAIEATQHVPEEDRRLVRVAVSRQGAFAMLRFENYFAGSVELVNGLPPTTKDDAHHHGYGLKNIRNVAEAYGGSLTIASEDGWFVLRMLLPVPDAGAGSRRQA